MKRLINDIEKVYREYSKGVYFYLVRLTGDEQLSEDLLQETFYQAIRTANRFRGDCSIKTWLCEIAKNRFYSYLKKNKSDWDDISLYEESVCNDNNLEEIVCAKAELVEIIEKVNKMGEVGEIFLMHIRDGFSYSEIAALKGKSEVWVRVNCFRVKQNIIKRKGLGV